MMKLFKLLFSIALFAFMIGSTVFIQENRTDIVHAASTSTPPPAAVNEIFPDPNLAAVIAGTLGVSIIDVVTQTQLDGLTDLGASYSNIGSIDGIEYLPNLAYFYLNDNQISDISPLASTSFSNLSYLGFGKATV
ncbi:internalin N-terminal domain-containing protein [Culicoidibacter larvae]|uniref:Internalin N-terminal domain-containing protein n=1 Tax=Culicoidibacter larvae TaxID=2579976 RepID=A0A5R8QH37_9FIRM|nr:leucine-rich repeat domain-containing protein [Culicoidibacter larvae]TLG77056.1 hypothetical protein FEZ08_00020 [Culicoidibacter larvae]